MDLSLRKEYKKYEKLTKDEKEFFLHNENVIYKFFIFIFIIAMFFIGFGIYDNILSFGCIVIALSLMTMLLIYMLYSYFDLKDFLDK